MQIEQAPRMDEALLSEIRHELRTQLNAIVGFTGTLLMKFSGPLTEGQEIQLKKIEASVNQLKLLLECISRKMENSGGV